MVLMTYFKDFGGVDYSDEQGVSLLFGFLDDTRKVLENLFVHYFFIFDRVSYWTG